jgi:hypothetical protein
MKTKTYISTLLFLVLLLSTLQYFQFIDIHTADFKRVVWCSFAYLLIYLLSDILEKRQIADLHYPLVYFFPVLLMFFVGDEVFTELCLAILVYTITRPALKRLTRFTDKYWFNQSQTNSENG